ncbi:MAG: DNA mismatch repair endonuclease MutL [Firmicutes bacterium]|nr:DNA mismatch repair endonuclease MutL [Bacillota bacterium]
MARIRVLSEDTIRKIAAGEVVERPASVVKELVENSLDAGAKRVYIEIEGGGSELIRVVDDGEGIPEEQLPLALERHATSKIRQAEDLYCITSLGFRGEALPSIAAVSFLEILSRPPGQTAGTRLALEGGKQIALEESPSPQGTTITVRQLFFNTPARKKFLKTSAAEAAQVADTVLKLAVARPEVAFRLVRDGRPVLATGGEGNLLVTVADLFGSELARGLIAIRGEESDRDQDVRMRRGSPPATSHPGATPDPSESTPSERSGTAQTRPARTPASNGEPWSRPRLSGLLGRPELARGKRSHQYLFLNGRVIKNPGLRAVVEEAYGRLLTPGRYPIFFVYLEMDPTGFDVNVHPGKHEVRFYREKEIRSLLYQAVRSSLARGQLIPEIGLAEGYGQRRPGDSRLALAEAGMVWPDRLFEAASAGKSSDAGKDACTGEVIESNPSLRTDKSGNPGATGTEELGRPSPESAEVAANGGGNQSAANAWWWHDGFAQLRLSLQTAPSESGLPELRILGQLGASYILAEGGDGLYFLDQHAVHERIFYDYFLRQKGKMDNGNQEYLFPPVFELSPLEYSWWEEAREQLRELGMVTREFGGTSVLVQAAPAELEQHLDRTLFLDLLTRLHEESSASLDHWGRAVTALAACQAAVKARDRLSHPEMERLVSDLAQCQDPFHCPHGRPTFLKITYQKLEQYFRRK